MAEQPASRPGGPGAGRRRRAISALAILTLVTVAAATLGTASAAETEQATVGPTLSRQATSYSVSLPVRKLEPSTGAEAPRPAPERINPLAGEPGDGARGTRGDQGRDPLVADSRAPGRTPAVDLTFEGTGNPDGCGTCSPPDTNGDVGPNHYVQMVNATKVAIYNKAGVLQLGPFELGDLWPVAETCDSSAGDPIVVYDEAADRWLLSQFASPSHLCFAISQTADPTGSYHLFTFNVGAFPDYFKVGQWGNAYYVGANEATYTSYAFDRTKMLAGDASASFIKFTGEDNFLLPADVDGPTQPTGGGLFYTFKDDNFHGGSDRLELFQLTPDFTTPANSTFSLLNTFDTIAPFTYTVCGFFVLDCIPQPGTLQKVDPVSEWPMHRFAFRAGVTAPGPTHDTLVGNFTVDTGSDHAGIRWFELRNTGAGWTLAQEGTHSPDTDHRWMGSIAMDKAGNIALGYSVSSTTTNPSIRYATRAPGDPAGTLQAEQTLQAGGGSQTGSNRWGDYSAMAVDPSDDCTFWYTNEYYPVSASTTWKTRIGNFIVPGCSGTPPPVFSVDPTSFDFGNQNVGTNSPFQTFTVTNTGTADLSISAVALTGGESGDFATQNDACTGATLTSSQTCTIEARFSPTAAGPRSTSLRFTHNAAGSPTDVPLTGTGVLPAPVFSASPTSVSFGDQDVDTTSAPQTVTVTNTGNAPLSIASVGITGGEAGDFAIPAGTDNCTGATLSPSQTCTIETRFSPTATGTRSTNLRFTDNAAGSPHDVALSGNGTSGGGGSPIFSAAPASLDFGSHLVGTTSAAQQVTVTNTGGGLLTISSATLATGNATEFAKQSDTCSGKTLAQGQSCTVGASFSPAAAGLRTTKLRFTDTAAGAPHDVALSGNGTTPVSNQFTFGAVTRNKDKGTATVIANLPGPGEIELSGRGVKPIARVAHRAHPRPVASGGPVSLRVKATGNKKQKLKRRGKVKVKIAVTYTPTGGSPATQTKKIRLKKRLRR